MIVGNAGILVSKVIYEKVGEERNFLILDAAMNDLIRPALYDAHHEIMPVEEKTKDVTAYDVVGPVCETGDRFARNRQLPRLNNNDLVAMMSAGAYGAVQASQYNTRALIPEVLVSNDQFSVIRRRPDFQEIVALEEPAPWLSF